MAVTSRRCLVRGGVLLLSYGATGGALRPYRRALPMSHAREEIKRCSGTQFDPQVVRVFSSIPEQHWIELRENLGSPFRLAHLKNL